MEDTPIEILGLCYAVEEQMLAQCFLPPTPKKGPKVQQPEQQKYNSTTTHPKTNSNQNTTKHIQELTKEHQTTTKNTTQNERFLGVQKELMTKP